VNVGVTNNGDIFGGSQITFGDVLGDQQFTFAAASIAQYRTISLSYVNLARRFQFALQGFSQTQFFYGQLGGLLYDPALAPLISRSDAVATRTVRGGTAIGIYPFSRYRRVELTGGLVQIDEEYNDPSLQSYSENYQQQNFGQQVFRNGVLVPLGAAFVQETTIFREFGPLAGNTMRLAYDVSPKIGGVLSRQTSSRGGSNDAASRSPLIAAKAIGPHHAAPPVVRGSSSGPNQPTPLVSSGWAASSPPVARQWNSTMYMPNRVKPMRRPSITPRPSQCSTRACVSKKTRSSSMRMAASELMSKKRR